MTRAYVFLCIGMVLADPYGGPVPTIINDPDHVTVEEGEAAVLPCIVKNQGPRTVVWTRSKKALTISRFIYSLDERMSVSDINNWNLRIDHVTTSDSGVYGCHVRTSTRLIYGNVTLVVTPRIVTSIPTGAPSPTSETTHTPCNDGLGEGKPPSSKISDEKLRLVQLRYYRDEILTNKKRRKMMTAEQDFYKAMQKFLRERKDD